MKLGRKERDLKWNYGIRLEQSPMSMKAYMLSVWIFKLDELPKEDYIPATITKGFILDIEFGLSDRVFSFRLPRIRSRIL